MVQVSAPPAGADHADDEQHRHRGNILQQQHRQRGASHRPAETLLVRQHLHDHRGGRHRQRRSDHYGQQRRGTECIGDRRDRHRAQHELQQPEAEHQPAHHLQPLQRHLQADHEHHHADAEFGDRRDRLGTVQHDGAKPRQTVGQQHKAVWAHRDADEHEPQYGADAQPMKQRDDDGRSSQDDQGRLEQCRIEVSAQVSVSEREQEAVERLRHETRRLDTGEMP